LTATCLMESQCTVGDICDDGDDCTMNDQYDTDCTCRGQLIDLNNNGQCDRIEYCDEEIIVTDESVLHEALIARSIISSSVSYGINMSSLDIIYSASDAIKLESGFELQQGSTLQVYNIGCLDE